jgi:hypothetical protein
MHPLLVFLLPSSVSLFNDGIRRETVPMMVKLPFVNSSKQSEERDIIPNLKLIRNGLVVD